MHFGQICTRYFIPTGLTSMGDVGAVIRDTLIIPLTNALREIRSKLLKGDSRATYKKTETSPEGLPPRAGLHSPEVDTTRSSSLEATSTQSVSPELASSE
jgi:hypothetical protein